MASLEGPRIKLSRAKTHINELAYNVRAYLESQPFILEPLEQPNGDLAHRVRIVHPIPGEWAAILGDAVHNMRTALDLLAWQCVEGNGGKPTRDTCFPIGPAPPSYEIALRRALTGAYPTFIRLVGRLRPHLGGNTVLTQLHALDIEDKHHLVLIVGAAHKHLVFKARMKVPWQSEPVEFPPIAINPADRQFPLVDGTEVFREAAAVRKGGLPTDYTQTFELAFGDVKEVRGLPLIATLKAMHAHVSRIVDITDRQLFPRPALEVNPSA